LLDEAATRQKNSGARKIIRCNLISLIPRDYSSTNNEVTPP